MFGCSVPDGKGLCERTFLFFVPLDALFESVPLKRRVFASLDQLKYRKYMRDHPKYRFETFKRSQPSPEVRALTQF